MNARPPGSRFIPKAVQGCTAEGVGAGGEKRSLLCLSHRATRAHYANPFGVLHSACAPFRPGLAMKRRWRA